MKGNCVTKYLCFIKRIFWIKISSFFEKNVHEIFPKFPLKEKENKKTRVFYRYLEEI